MSSEELSKLSDGAVDHKGVEITAQRREAMKARAGYLKVHEDDRRLELASMRAAQKLQKAQKQFPGDDHGNEYDAVTTAQRQWRKFRAANIENHKDKFFKAGAADDLTVGPTAIPKSLRPGKGKALSYNRSENKQIFRRDVSKYRDMLRNQRLEQIWEQRQQLQQNQLGGLVKGFASGGRIGPDTVPVMMAPGEFVVNAESARGMIPYLSRLNRYGASAMGGTGMGAQSGGRIPGMQGGGIVGGGAAGGEPVGGVNIPNSEGLADAMMQLVDIAQGIRDTVDNSAEEDGRKKQTGEAEGEGAPAAAVGATNNITITVNVGKGGAEGESEVTTSRDGENEEGEDSGDDPEKNEKFAEMLKGSVIQVITEQQRPGGLLAD